MQNFFRSQTVRNMNSGLETIFRNLESRNDLNNVFLESEDPFSLSKLGKTCILKWNMILKQYEETLAEYSSKHFINGIQTHPFNDSVKSKLILVLKFLTYIMKYTFNHEIYIIDSSHSNFLISYDLDVSYHSYLFHNEYYNDFLRVFNSSSYLYLKTQNFSFYTEKIFDIYSDEEDKQSKVKISYMDKRIESIQAGIKSKLESSISDKKMMNPYEFEIGVFEFSRIHSEILRYECYKYSDFQKLLSIEILANVLSTKIFYSYNLEIILFCINLFLSNEAEECLIESLIVYSSNISVVAICQLQIQRIYFHQSFIKELFSKHKSYSPNFSNQNHLLLYNRLFIILNFLNKDFKILKPDFFNNERINASEIFSFFPYIIYILHDELYFSRFIQIFLNFDTKNICESLFSLTELKNKEELIVRYFITQINIFTDYKDNIMLLFEIFIKIIRHIYSNNLDEEQKEFLLVFFEKIHILTENFEHYDFIFIDFINSNVIKILIEIKPEKYFEIQYRILENIFNYYFDATVPLTVTAFENVIYLIRFMSHSSFKIGLPFFIEKLLYFHYKNLEFSVFLFIFTSKVHDIESELKNILEKNEEVKCNIDLIIDSLNTRFISKNLNMDVFLNVMKICKLNPFSEKLHIFLNNLNDKNTIKEYFYYDFHLIFVLRLLKTIFLCKNILLETSKNLNLHELINIPEETYNLRIFHLVLEINEFLYYNLMYEHQESFLIVDLMFIKVVSFENLVLEESCNLDDKKFLSHKYLIKVVTYLKYLDKNIKFICKSSKHPRKYELVERITNLLEYIYKRIFFYAEPTRIKCKNESILLQDLKNHIDNIFKLDNEFISSLIEYVYCLILKNLIEFNEFSAVKNPNDCSKSISFISFFHKISSDLAVSDPNLISLFYTYLRTTNEPFKSEYKISISIILTLMNHLVNYNRQKKIESKREAEFFRLILSELFFKTTTLELKEMYKCLELILDLMITNSFFITKYDFFYFFNSFIPCFRSIIKVISSTELFIKILDLIAKIETTSMNPLRTFFIITRETLLYDFLSHSFFSLNYINFFTEAQKNHDSIFLFIYTQISQISDPKTYFFREYSDLSDYLKILRININLNIENNRMKEYKKQNILLPDLTRNFKQPCEVFTYLISLVRLSNYSNCILKNEIYEYFHIIEVLRLIDSDFVKMSKNLEKILEYAYKYLLSLFEDEFYLICSFVFIIESYNNLPKNIFKYFNQKLIHTSGIQNIKDINSNPILDKEIKIKQKILKDMIDSIGVESYSSKIVTLQFLSEIISTFPALLYFIKPYILNSFVNFLDSLNVLDHFFSLGNWEKWNLNFRYGYFITVALYRSDLCYVNEIIEYICLVLKTSNINRSFFLISLIYRILVSEICCCKYIQYLNRKTQYFFDKNCKNNFEKRKTEIFKIFISNNILRLILNNFEDLYSNQTTIPIFQIQLINVLNIFSRFVANNKISISEKYLTCSTFRFYLPNSSNFLYPISLYQIKSLDVYKIIHCKKNQIQSYKKILSKQISKLEIADFGYINRYHNGMGICSVYKEIMFSNLIIYLLNLNLNVDHLNEIETAMKMFFCRNLSNKDVATCLESKLNKYNLPKCVLDMIHLNLDFSKKDMKKYILDDEINEIFSYDNILTKKYAGSLNGFDLSSKKNTQVFELSKDQKEYYEEVNCKLFIHLCIFSTDESLFKSIKLMRKILVAYYNSNKYQNFIQDFQSEISRLKSSEKYLKYDEKIQNLESILEFYSNENQMDYKNMILNFLFFELLHFKNIGNYCLDNFFVTLKIFQDFLNTEISEQKSENILYQILEIHKRKSKSIVRSVLNIYLYSFEQVKYFLLKSSFVGNRKYNISKVTCLFKELEVFYDLINEQDLFFIGENIEYFLYFFESISENSLNIFFIKFIDYKSQMLVLLFEKYIKILVKCCKLYSMTRNLIFNHEEFNTYKIKLMYKDFLSYIFKIDGDKIPYRDIIDQTNENFENLLVLFFRIKNLLKDRDQIFSQFTFISLEIKLLIIARINININSPFYNQFLLSVDRNNIIDSTIDFFENESTENFLFNNWTAKFVNEDGEGIGLLHEFFRIYGKAIDESIYFMPFKTLDFVSIKVSKENQSKMEKIYYYSGVIIAKSIIMNSVMGIEFIESFYMFLKQDNIKIENLENIDPEFYKSIIYLRENTEKLDSMNLDFSILVKVGKKIEPLDLIENGASIDVTKENLEEYIKMITEFKVYKGMKVYLDKLKEGFNLVFTDFFYDIFTYTDLKVILEGEKKIDVTEWRVTTQYGDEYCSEHQIIIWFWNFVEKLNDIDIKKLFAFATGLEKLPIGGFKSSKFLENPFRINYNSCKNSLPRAHTCFNLLILPKYDDENTLIENLKLAMETKNYYLT